MAWANFSDPFAPRRPAHDRPDERGPGAGGNEAGRLPQGRRGIGVIGARDHAGRSVLGRCLCVPGKTGPSEADLLGRHGVCLFAKRLEDGKFRWPSVQDAVMRLSAAELSALLEELDWKWVHAAREDAAGMIAAQ